MKNSVLIPLAIIASGALVAVAIVFSGGDGEKTTKTASDQAHQTANIEVRDVTEADFIRGSIDAPVKIIEFSDTECPFCKQFHGTMQQVVETYPDDVAWVYRHFPVAGLHPNAFKEAEATECAAELGGKEAFWAFVDRLYEITPGNNRFDLDELPKIAEFVGLDVNNFNQCLESGDMAERVQEDLDDARTAAQAVPRVGTPFSIIVAGDQRVPIVGAQPFEVISQAIEELL